MFTFICRNGKSQILMKTKHFTYLKRHLISKGHSETVQELLNCLVGQNGLVSSYIYICVCVCIYIYIYMCVYIYTVGTESIQTPFNFSLFVILQPFAKII